ncbi:MAG: hypothetical protein ACTSYI_05195 [Promethearchaeota archaeon]
MEDLFSNYWPKTNFETDVLIASKEKGKPIAFAALLKKESVEKPWSMAYNVCPEYDTTEVANLLFPEMLNIAKEQKAPGLITSHQIDQTDLKKVIQSQNFIAYHNTFMSHLKSLDNLPKIAIPMGFSFEKSSQITDPIHYVNVMNEAYKNFEGFVPGKTYCSDWITIKIWF